MLLVPHPTTTLSTVQEIDVSVWQDDCRWHFRYLIESTSELVLPDPRPAARAHGLWQHTCMEAFVGLSRGAYLEFNFSPSTEWAAYRFDAPRHGMRGEPAEVEVWLDLGEDWLGLEAAIRSSALEPGLALGLSAVIEEAGGRKSYWALKHPAGPPDFHERACFVAVLANIAAS